MPSKKKSIDEARSRLQEKLNEVKHKAQNLHSLIDNLSKEAVSIAEASLKETSKSKFLHSYPNSSQELEKCLNKFLLLSDALESLDGSDEEGEEEESGEDDDEEDEKDNTSVFTTTGPSTSTAILEEEDNHIINTLTDVTLPSDVTSSSTVVTLSQYDDVSFLPNDVTLTNHDDVKARPPDVRKRTNSQDSIFSSVSTQFQSTPMVHHKSPIALSPDISVERYKWEQGVAYPVLITNFISPWEFHLQLVNPENDVMEKMCITYMKDATQGYRGGIDVLPSVGMFCCARYTDETWYRAKIVDVISKGTITEDFKVQVYFIDEGFFSVVGSSHLRPLDEKFANMLPSQAFHCIMGGVQPIEALQKTNKNDLGFQTCSNLWTKGSKAWFQQQMDIGLFDAYFNAPPRAAYTGPHLIGHDVITCDLFTHAPNNNSKLWKFSYERPELESHLGFMLITKGFASHCFFFESELNRKKSQRILRETVEKLKGGEVKTQPQGACAVDDQKPSYPNPKPDAVLDEKEKKVAIKSHDTPSQNQKHDSPKQLQNQEEEKKSRPNKNAKKRNKNKAKKASAKRNSSESDSSSSTTSCSTTAKRPPLNTEPMQIEILPDAKNTEKHFKDAVNPTIDVVQARPESQESENKASAEEEIPQITDDPQFESFIEDPPEEMHREKSPIEMTIVGDIEQPKFQFSTTYRELSLHVKKDTFVKVFVSEVINPGLFYVHLVSPQVAKLDAMMERLNNFYDSKEEEIRQFSQRTHYEEGVAVIARYPEDYRWYRGLIVSKCHEEEGEETEDSYNILYVDYGSNEVAAISNILPVCKEFCELPMETIPCCLADISPTSPFISSERCEDVQVIPAGDESSDEENDVILTEGVRKDIVPPKSPSALSKWSEISISSFKKVSLIELPLLAALKSPQKNDNGLYEVYLYDTTNDRDLFINQFLVDEGVVTSKVFSKTTPVVQITELELEEQMKTEGEMAVWDPMEEQYMSNRNAYSVDVNNPAVAMLGYVEKEKNICHQYLRGRCYRGSSCRFAHVKPGDIPQSFEEVFCTDDIVTLPDLGDWVPVTVTACLHPAHFWINLPCGSKTFSQKAIQELNLEEDPLIQLNETMNNFYSQVKRKDETDLTILAEGELVAACYQGDWYRARVTNTAEDLVQVFYVDYGNTQVIGEESIRKLIPDFLHLPLQCVECTMNGVDLQVNLPQHNLILYNELRLKFQELTADKLLMALVVAKSPRKDLVLDVYDTSVEPHVCINKIVSSWEGMEKVKAISNENFFKNVDGKKREFLYPG